VVQHPDGGVVERILVDEGDVVSAEAALVTLDPTLLNSDLSVVEGQLFEMIARRGRLEAERDDFAEILFDPMLDKLAGTRPDLRELIAGQERLFHARRQSLSHQIEQLMNRRTQIASQLEAIRAQQTSLGVQIALLDTELADQQTLLERGLTLESRVLSLQRERARLNGSMGELEASRAEAGERMSEVDIEILKLRTLRHENAIAQLRDLRQSELELTERRRALLERLDRLDIRAPVGGVVYGLTVFAPRSVIRPAEPVLYIVPQDRPLVIAVRVDPIHIDQVHPGQPVRLRFLTFDSRTTPELTGEVVQVSADAFWEERTGIAFYRAEIQLPEDEIGNLPPELRLIPGMPVEAFLSTDARTPLEFLIRPLSDYFVRAFRET